MISFENDYLEGAHENVLQRLFDTNLIQASGYGDDQFSKQAKRTNKICYQLSRSDCTILSWWYANQSSCY